MIEYVAKIQVNKNTRLLTLTSTLCAEQDTRQTHNNAWKCHILAKCVHSPPRTKTTRCSSQRENVYLTADSLYGHTTHSSLHFPSLNGFQAWKNTNHKPDSWKGPVTDNIGFSWEMYIKACVWRWEAVMGRQQRGRGDFLNLSDGSTFCHMPLYLLYLHY